MPAGQRTRVGDLRPSQLMHAFGVGSVVDLPYLSVMVMGLEDWPAARSIEIREERLLRAVRQQLGAQVARLLAPPTPPESSSQTWNPFDEESRIGVPVAPFPRWVVCPYCRLLAPLSSGLFEFKPEPYRPDRARFVHASCKRPGQPPAVLPARFLIACDRGHLDDFPWLEFVHKGPTTCKGPLKFLEMGASGEAADVQVKCDACETSEVMAKAFTEEARRLMPACRGRRPHLRDFDPDGCTQQVKSILLGASNSWFPMVLSALSIPSGAGKLDQLLEQQWSAFESVKDSSALEALRRFGVLREFAEFTDDQIWEALQRMREGDAGQDQDSNDLKAPEWAIFSNPDALRNTRDLQLRPVAPPPRYQPYFERVVLVERLREVRSLIGFTRIDTPSEDAQTARAPLSRGSPHWVPSAEIRGEGIFLQFSEAAISTWVARCGLLDQQFLAAHQRWRSTRGMDPMLGYPGLRYVLLHSLAHALIRQFSLECGYATASLRERIYSGSTPEGGPMAGVLIYTAAQDSEGTMGGLVSLGETTNLEGHLDQSLEGLELCTSDPLCAESTPEREFLSLHGAACHACLFAPETSCERGNRYLDRSVLVETVERSEWAFFNL